MLPAARGRGFNRASSMTRSPRTWRRWRAATEPGQFPAQAQAGAQGGIANTLKAQQGNQSAALRRHLVNQAAQGLGAARHSADAEQCRQLPAC